MDGFLVDTNILSEYSRPGGANPGVKHWVEMTDIDLQYVSVITLAEIQKGIELLVDGKRRVQLKQWFKDDLEMWFLDRILAVDRRVAERWALLVAQTTRIGRPLPTFDSFIAATALTYNPTVVTRNTRDFVGIGLNTLNPETLSRVVLSKVQLQNQPFRAGSPNMTALARNGVQAVC